MKIRKLPICIMLALSAIFCGARFCEAGDAPLNKTYGENVLKPGELKACIKRGKALDKNKADVKRLSTTMSSLEKELKKLQGILKKGVSSLATEEETNTHEKQVTGYNQAKSDYPDIVTEYKYKYTQYRIDVNAYNAECKRKQFFKDDYQKAKQEVEAGE